MNRFLPCATGYLRAPGLDTTSSRAARPEEDTLPTRRPVRTSWKGVCALLLLAGCVPRPTDPILGDWRGTQPGPFVELPKIVELVLDGAPNAMAGRYHIAITVQNTKDGAGSGTTRWQGEWTGDQEAVDGRVLHVIHLQHMVDGEIDRYELAADGTLRPVNRAGPNPYSATQIALYTLQPLRRDSWNYGID